ncbi:hypothetical protein LUZ63_017523 [Rhynchospora breviuscula]|uniref:Uncharacterized protein n=1 Tax=Rhynchospora breviuscula TaxID=2022672 RepID=A0A9Q0C2L8_9POAL|nr:hypothetical protein LUZ63_017523 [Rhynchospora breviuscula]
MWSSSSEPNSPVTPQKSRNRRPTRQSMRSKEEHAERGVVMLEGYVESPDNIDERSNGNGEPVAARTKSLTDDDLEELKGCVDLGFGFNYEEIPELCNTLPALELCYSMSQKFLEESSSKSAEQAAVSTPLSSSPIPVANWKISSPGDNPDEVKARLKYWAQAVACTVKLCS